ncbi:hypothetical protein ACGFZA_31840 [Streptomyces sp. NPDC048211]|uniref:hypothetical protein n=1 Tax=Streptomyces sp. NPDC048211 TaxID=3365516 RepID=UPI0037209C50
MAAAAVAAAAMAGLCTRAGLLIPGGLPCLVIAGFCAEGAAYVRRTAHRLQEQYHQARLLAELGADAPYTSWCCEGGFLTIGASHRPGCTREPQ